MSPWGRESNGDQHETDEDLRTHIVALRRAFSIKWKGLKNNQHSNVDKSLCNLSKPPPPDT